MKKQPLTARQQQILDWIKDFGAKNGFPPTRIEIANAFSFRQNSAQCVVRTLENKGWLELVEGISRGIRVVP